VFVVSAPSGAGKHAVLHRVLSGDPNAVYSISATTRPPRAGEQDGRDYHFIDRAAFMRRREASEFVEWAEVHGHLYGTLHVELERRITSGKDVILQIDVQGMRNLKNLRPDAVAVFIMPPSLEVLEQRLRSRGTNDDRDIALRLENARREIDAANEFDYVIVNNKLDDAVADMQAIIRAERCRNRH
jgi:guanylate kinase